MVFKSGTLMNLIVWLVWFSHLATVVLKTNCFVSKPLRTNFLHNTRFIHQNITMKIKDATSWHITSSLDVRNTFNMYKNSSSTLLHTGLRREKCFFFEYHRIVAATNSSFVSFAAAILIPTTNPQPSIRSLGTQTTVAVTLQWYWNDTHTLGRTATAL